MAFLDTDTEEHIRLSADEAHALGTRALRSLGYTADEAGAIAEHLVDNSLCGYAFAGLPRILAIADNLDPPESRRPIGILHETPVSALVDGGGQVGYLSVNRGVEVAIEKVRQSGIAVVGVANSWFSGRNAYYLEKIARAGYVGIHTVSGTPMVVPVGATRPILGTNPLAIALPGERDPFIFDMGTGATMSGEVLLKAFLDQDFDEEVGVDAQGVPTRRAKDIVGGGILPFAGHKGHGLSIAIQAMGLLAGARLRQGEVSDFGFLIIAFDPALLIPPEQFKAQLAELIAKIKALPRQPGVDEIRIPSERSFREREIRRREGILLQRRVHERLQEMCRANG